MTYDYFYSCLKTNKMKYLNKILFSGLLLSALAACSSSNNTNEENSKTGKEYTSAYICPMHCEGSGSDSTGICPVCKMDYVKNEEHSHEGHSH